MDIDVNLENTKKSCCSNFFQNQIVARGKNAVVIPAVLLEKIGDLIHGGCLAISSVLTLSLDRYKFNQAVDSLSQGGKILAKTFENVLGTLNPQNIYVFGDLSFSYKHSCAGHNSQFKRGHEIFNEKVLARGTPFGAHVSNRFMALGALLKIIFFRVIDTVICLFAVPAAILTLGKIEKLNEVAYSTLHFPVVLADIFFFTTKIFNPWAGIDNEINLIPDEEEIKLDNNLKEKEVKEEEVNHEEIHIIDNKNGENQINQGTLKNEELDKMNI